MKRRLNFTGRQKIPRRNIIIVLNKENGIATSFTAKVDLSDFQFPEDAKVYIDAYHRTDQKRYDFGTVSAINTPSDTSLENLARIENLKFRLLVVDKRRTFGLILAHADRISPIPEGERKSILPVDFKDLGQQIWKVEYEGYEGEPVLFVNNRLPNIQSVAKLDPLFFFFVFPSVIREILTHMVFVDGVDSVEEPSIGWHANWLEFTRRILSGEGSPSILDPRSESFDREEAESWIDKIVEEFCSSRREWPQFVSRFMGGDSQS